LTPGKKRLRRFERRVFGSARQRVIPSIPPIFSDPARDVNPAVRKFNAFIPEMVRAHRKKGHEITGVDVYPAITVDDLLTDGLHPNIYGNRKTAGIWDDAVCRSLYQ
jgi:hypothetical protein